MGAAVPVVEIIMQQGHEEEATNTLCTTDQSPVMGEIITQ